MIDRRTQIVIGTAIALFLLFIPLSMVLGVNYTYTLQTVALGGALLGIVSGVIGCFAVLRQQSLMGDALSHAALPGVAMAFLFSGRQLGVLLIGAGIASWLGVQFVSAVTRTTRIKQDAAMGIVLTAWFALGIALLAYIQGRPDASQAGLDRFIFGQAAAIVQQDVQLIAVVGLIVFAVLALFWKEFKLITFDIEFARANGYQVRFFEVLLSTLIVVAVVLGLQLAGVILMVGLLIAPAVAARQWTHQLGPMVILAGVFGAFSGSVGAIISAVDVGLPTGPLIIVVAFVIVLVSICFAPERGLVWSLWRQRQDRQRFAALNVMRDIYHYALGHGDDPQYPAPEQFLIGIRGQTALVGLHELASDDIVVKHGDSWSFTEAGAAQAAQDVHNQALWDSYQQHSDDLKLPALTEDRRQDISELLTMDELRRLEDTQKEA